MSCLFRKLDYLVLNGRAVSGSGSLYDTGIDGRAVYILADDRVSLFIGISQVAGDLLDLDVCRIRGIGEGDYDLISLLDRHLGVIQSPSVHSGRRACLKSAERNADPVEGILEAGRSLHAAGTCLCDGFSHQAPGVEISAGADDCRLTSVNSAGMDSDADNFSVFRENLRDLRLADRQILLALQHLPHSLGVLRLIGLRPERVDGRALGDVEHLGLDESLIYIFAHLTAQGIDFPDQMALGRSPDVRIAGHHGDAVHIHCKDHGLKSEPAAGQRGLDTGVAGSDHTHLCIDMVFHILSFPVKARGMSRCAVFTFPNRIWRRFLPPDRPPQLLPK